MSKKVLQVKMFGGFSLFYEGGRLSVGRDINSRLLQLLQLLLLNVRTEGIPKTSLIRALYGREEVANENGTLNSAIFRLRKNLKKTGLPDCEYVILENGRCRWNEKIPVEVDVLQFEQLIRNGQKEKFIPRRMEFYLDACRLYAGEFLPGITREWARIRDVSCQNLYTSALSELCVWLMEQKRYEEVYQLSSAAARLCPFDDWGLYQMDSLIAMSRYEEALQVYENTTRRFFDEFGLQPSEEMLERAHIMARGISQSTEIFTDIRRRLREKEKRPGAYYCTYPCFIDIYRVVCRMAERNGVSVFVLTCTLAANYENSGPEEKEAADMLKEAILASLRRGDFFTRYSERQYLVLLTGIRQEDCSKVSARIEEVFHQGDREDMYRLECSIFSSGDIDED